MLDSVLKKAGDSAGAAVGAGGEDVAGGYIDLMLSPYGLIALVVVFLLIRAIR
jgi:hypothetical protein